MTPAPIVRPSVAFTVVLLSLCALVVSAQGPARDPDWTAPPEYASTANPLASRPEAAAGGAKIFAQRCATCHGRDGRGTRKAPSLADPSVHEEGDGALFWKISSGNARSGMPAFSFLPELQRWQLVLHIGSLAAVP
jgi:mono/diheme cytochrome c family protein